MSISSVRDQTSTTEAAREREAALAPITLSERSSIGLALLRIGVGYLWFQQLFWKLPPDFAGLHRYLAVEAQHTFLPGYSYILQHVFIPNFTILAASVWTAEFVVSICLLFGVFTRLGAIIATLLSIQLFVGLAYAPGEWYWTYGMLVLLGLFLTAIPAGRRLGVDQWLAPRLRAKAQSNRLSRWLGWLV